ncbi:MAG TPA: hypothetical protein PLL33_12670 [Paracoccus sp. (in: a-proteobacteria)]|nr:hypothetical protein [Paracoccus sp. (in: a-proteobacteria)]
MTGFDIAVLLSGAGVALVAVLYARWASERFDEAHRKGQRHPAE